MARLQGIAVTSIAPQHPNVRQQINAIRSWRALGLTVYSINRPDELLDVQFSFGDLAAIVPRRRNYARHWSVDRIAISDALDLIRGQRLPSLLINADVAIDDTSLSVCDAIRAASNGVVTLGIRHNYTDDPATGTREPFGIDALAVSPETVQNVPETPFCFGIPFWDYWLPWYLHTTGTPLAEIQQPCFFHRKHPLGWNQTNWFRAAALFRDLVPDGPIRGRPSYDWFKASERVRKSIAGFVALNNPPRNADKHAPACVVPANTDLCT